MTQQILISTKKGLFTAVGGGRRGWQLSEPEFRGVPVSMALFDPRDGACYAALDHGHFGVKLHRKLGKRWQELPAPVYPQLPKGKVEKDAGGRPWPRTLRRVEPRTTRAHPVGCGAARSPAVCSTPPMPARRGRSSMGCGT